MSKLPDYSGSINDPPASKEEKLEKFIKNLKDITTPTLGSLSETQKAIFNVCVDLMGLLLIKNCRYGNSALEPLGIFSKELTRDGGILVRIDDKLNRVKNSSSVRKNDVVDLLGYLVLLCVKSEWTNLLDLID
jgi:hypothetical protein